MNKTIIHLSLRAAAVLAVLVFTILAASIEARAQTAVESDYILTLVPNYDGGPSTEVHIPVSKPYTWTLSATAFNRTDYIIVGWAETADGAATYAANATVTLTGDLTLYAKWAKTTCYVDFNANGGTGTMKTVTKTGGTDYTIPACGFTRDGYVFIGWATSDVGNVVYQPGQTITLTDDLTLYAKWGTNHTVTFYANGGTGTMDPVTQAGSYTIPGCGFTREDYTFIGWATSDVGNVVYHPGDVITLTDDLTLYAKWDDTVAYWEVSESGDILTFYGAYVMDDYIYYSSPPWSMYNSDIKTLVINDGMTAIGNYAFRDFNQLTSVSLPGSLTSIGKDAFALCSALTTITIPSNVTAIKVGAFMMTGLTSIDIPASVTTIGNDAFLDCSSLASVTVRATTPPQLVRNAFNGNASGRKIYVPGEVLNVYKNATGWSDYADDILPIVPYIDADGNMAYCTNYVEVTSDLQVFEGNTWYVVNSDVLMSNSIQVLGEVSLILCDGATLTLNDLDGRLGNDKITIYGQSGGTGTLKGNNTIVLNHDVSLIINGGSVTANGDSNYAIYSIGGNVVINGGSVTATILGYGKAIYSWGGNVVINGGSVTAKCDYYGTAIYSEGGNVVINGGNVMATASGNYDAIDCTSGNTVTIAEQMIDCTSGTKRVITESIDGNMATALKSFFDDADNDELVESVNASFSRSFKENVASTLCLPFPMTSIESGTCYEFTSVNDAWTEVTMTNVNATSTTPLTAGKPYLFMPAADGQVNFTGTIANVASSYSAGTKTVAPWAFNGTYEEKRWDATHNTDEIGRIFGFATNQGYEGQGPSQNTKAGDFIRLNTGGIKPFRAYLKYTGTLARTRGEGGLPETMTVRLVGANGEIQGIGEIKLDTGEVTFDSRAWYDLNGRRLDGKPSEKGIYINGGRKVVIK